MKVALVDTGHANLRSVERALLAAGEHLGRSVEVLRTNAPEHILDADKLVVPGQGGFGDCLRGLAGGADQALVEAIGAGKHYFGICLGLQALFETSEEASGTSGLGVFAGSCRRLTAESTGTSTSTIGRVKIPHMGWNQVALEHGSHPVLDRGLVGGGWFYFVHSYHAVPTDAGLVKGVSDYGDNRVTAAVGRDNVLATQFHPEKSQLAGIRLLSAFLNW